MRVLPVHHGRLECLPRTFLSDVALANGIEVMNSKIIICNVIRTFWVLHSCHSCEISITLLKANSQSTCNPFTLIHHWKPNVIITNSVCCTVCTRILLSIYYPRGYRSSYSFVITSFPNFFPFVYLTATNKQNNEINSQSSTMLA